MTKIVSTKCPTCGNIVFIDVDTVGPDEDWLECLPLDKSVAKIPVGYRSYPSGEILWTDAQGRSMTPEEYKKVHGVDPETVWRRMGKSVQKYL